jgi:hypothetical protein
VSAALSHAQGSCDALANLKDIDHGTVQNNGDVRDIMRHIDTTMVFDVSDSESHAQSDSDSHIMIPQCVLAERKSLSGECEVLVVWQPNWIPSADLRGMQSYDVFQRASHCKFSSMIGSLTLPVDRGSKLADDVSIVAGKASRQIIKFHTAMADAIAPQIVRVQKAASSRTTRSAGTADMTKVTAPTKKARKQ